MLSWLPHGVHFRFFNILRIGAKYGKDSRMLCRVQHTRGARTGDVDLSRLSYFAMHGVQVKTSMSTRERFEHAEL